MENKLQIFTNEQFGSVRIVGIDGEGWLVGKDVAEILGYVNSRDALAKHVDEEDKRVSQIATPSGTQSMTVINESGLYSLILSSKLPKAKEFKHWVTAEVLPTIRKYGVYATKDFALKAIADPKFAVEIFTALLAEREEKRTSAGSRRSSVGADCGNATEGELLRLDSAEQRGNASKRHREGLRTFRQGNESAFTSA